MKKLIPLLILIVMAFSGCSTSPSVTEIPFSFENRHNSQADRLNDSTGKINDLTKKPEVQVETAKIDIVATELRQDSKSRDDLVKRIKELEADAVREKSEREKDYQQTLGWGVKLGGLMVIIGIVLCIASIKVPFLSEIGFLTLAAGACLMSVCYGMQVHSEIVGYIGGFISIAVIGYGVYMAIKKHEANKTKDVALVDMVKTVELVKPHLTNWNNVKKTVSQMHNPTTQELVKLIKRKEVNNFS